MSTEGGGEAQEAVESLRVQEALSAPDGGSKEAFALSATCYAAESGRRFDKVPSLWEFDRMPGRLKKSLVDEWRGFVV